MKSRALTPRSLLRSSMLALALVATVSCEAKPAPQTEPVVVQLAPAKPAPVSIPALKKDESCTRLHACVAKLGASTFAPARMEVQQAQLNECLGELAHKSEHMGGCTPVPLGVDARNGLQVVARFVGSGGCTSTTHSLVFQYQKADGTGLNQRECACLGGSGVMGGGITTHYAGCSPALVNQARSSAWSIGVAAGEAPVVRDDKLTRVPGLTLRAWGASQDVLTDFRLGFSLIYAIDGRVLTRSDAMAQVARYAKRPPRSVEIANMKTRTNEYRQLAASSTLWDELLHIDGNHARADGCKLKRATHTLRITDHGVEHPIYYDPECLSDHGKPLRELEAQLLRLPVHAPCKQTSDLGELVCGPAMRDARFMVLETDDTSIHVAEPPLGELLCAFFRDARPE